MGSAIASGPDDDPAMNLGGYFRGSGVDAAVVGAQLGAGGYEGASFYTGPGGREFDSRRVLGRVAQLARAPGL